MPLLPCLLALALPAGPYTGLVPADHADAPTFRSDEPVVGTHFFYWYKQSTGKHWFDYDGSDALTDHPLYRGGDYSYDRVEWWVRQIETMRLAGIDFMALVYWGLPGMDDSDHHNARQLAWSNIGARTLAELVEGQLKRGETVMPVGMFYDTSTLQTNQHERKVDLTAEWGKEWFYETIRDFFSLIPPRAWARIDGNPIVILYGAGYAERVGADLFGYAKDRFRGDFGVGLHIIKNQDWPGEADDVISWGGALGPILNTTAAVGPGYDHSAVPHREPLIVDREGGAFYQRGWESLLARHPAVRPRLVMVETWNELHEGTEVAPTAEHGYRYVHLTRQYADLWRSGVYRPPTGLYTGACEVSWRPLGSRGIEVRDAADGPVRGGHLDGRMCLESDPTRDGRFIYVNVDRSFAFDAPMGPVELELTYWDGGYQRGWIEYDSLDLTASVRAGAFKSGPSLPPSTSEGWRRVTFQLDDMRFGDRCNRADLRLVIEGGLPAIAEVRVRLLGQPEAR